MDNIEKVDLTKYSIGQIVDKSNRFSQHIVFELNIVNFIIGIALSILTSRIRFLLISSVIIGETFGYSFMYTDAIEYLVSKYNAKYSGRDIVAERKITRYGNILKLEGLIIYSTSYIIMMLAMFDNTSGYRYFITILAVLFSWFLCAIHISIIKSNF